MNIFLERKEDNLTATMDAHVLNVVFSVNRACNLRCNHCCLSNEYKATKNSISLEMMDNYFSMIDLWLSKGNTKISHISFLMSGGEISLLSDEVFMSYGDRIYQFYQRCAEKFPYIEFSYAILSNLIDLSERKKEWLVELHRDAIVKKLIFNLFTSYERYTNRFHKPLILKKWEDNIQWAKSNDIEPIVIWSISKRDAQNATDIVKYFEQLDVKALYVPVLPTGETLNNENIAADYEDFISFLNQVYTYPYKKTMFTEQVKPYEYDRLANLILDQILQ